ncbi:FkbM family methyltransferase [Rhizobium sp. L245/93]|uniref:FkbM family methyltransferase n=1 Tax=Rhizobium sp. L245/93 TaxID=2819998 RepID=UPI001ADAD29D|nr:FkbM family methyltransferase [Rhizobium sp. L245/93]MBO9170441.1 FkbM family methyltransferase [Rhizobium sp. L245/93]
MLSYAQNFEDVMLERLFAEVESGFYVDIGAWDPKVHSVTQHFYDRGWNGVNVEPLANRHRMFVSERPRDINLNNAVSVVGGSVRFYECPEDSALSTVEANVADAMRSRGLLLEEYDVEAVTISHILEKFCPKNVEFLKIDVEGLEGQLLQGLDLSHHRPRALVIESTVPATRPKGFDRFDEVEAWSSWEPSIISQDYIFAHFDGLNRFYLRQEDAKLVSRLAIPPGIFDHFELFAEVEKINAIDADRKAIDADRRAKDEIISRLLRDIEVIEADRAARLDQINTLTKIIHEMRNLEENKN